MGESNCRAAGKAEEPELSCECDRDFLNKIRRCRAIFQVFDNFDP